MGSQRIYLLYDLVGNTALGFLKVGPKKLFMIGPTGTKAGQRGLQEVEPLCLLDIYVTEGNQQANGFMYGLLARTLFRQVLTSFLFFGVVCPDRGAI